MTSSESRGPRPRVYRTWTGTAFLVVSAAVVVFLLGDAVVRAGSVRMLLLAPWVLIALWLVYVAAAASHVRTPAAGVTVQNFVRRTSFGWRHLRDVNFRWQLEFSLDDGSTVTAMGGPARSRPRRDSSGLDAPARKPAGVVAVDEIRALRRSAPRDADAPIRRSWDWPALIVLAGLVIWSVAATIVT